MTNPPEKNILDKARRLAVIAKDAVAMKREYPAEPYPSETAFPHPVCNYSETMYERMLNKSRRVGKSLRSANNTEVGRVVRRSVSGIERWNYTAQRKEKLPVLVKNSRHVTKSDAGFTVGETTALVKGTDVMGSPRMYLGVVTRTKVEVIRPVTTNFQKLFLSAFDALTAPKQSKKRKR